MIKIPFHTWHKNTLRKLPTIIASRAFLAILLLILLALALGIWSSYYYVFWAETGQAQVNSTNIKFNDNAYKAVQNQWVMKERRFKQSETLPDINIFKP